MEKITNYGVKIERIAGDDARGIGQGEDGSAYLWWNGPPIVCQEGYECSIESGGEYVVIRDGDGTRWKEVEPLPAKKTLEVYVLKSGYRSRLLGIFATRENAIEYAKTFPPEAREYWKLELWTIGGTGPWTSHRLSVWLPVKI